MMTRMRHTRRWQLIFSLAAIFFLLATTIGVQADSPAAAPQVYPPSRFINAAAFDVSPAFRDLAKKAPAVAANPTADEVEVRPERGVADSTDRGFTGDQALGAAPAMRGLLAPPLTIPNPLLTFEGLRNTDNPFLVAPPDPVGDVGPNHYVQMVNLVYAVYSRNGDRLMGPTPIGALWDGFPITDCTDLSGDPVVLYDQLEDRWILSQFTTRGPIYYNCVAVSQTGDPTGAFYRYAFPSGEFFPDYPKYGVWSNMYVLTTREFGPTIEYRIGVYALEKAKMLDGNPNARAVAFYLDARDIPLYLLGDGLLPPDIDGNRRPQDGAPAPIIGTQDDDAHYGAPSDALNVYELSVQWRANPVASLRFTAQLPVADFVSTFPCTGSARNCIPQPGTAVKLDILSYRQRPTYRLAYRNFGTYEALVTNQSVQARPGVAGVRWYEIRRTNGLLSLYQQGTYAPDDGVHRWMGSIAMDHMGNMALGYSVSNATDVYPGIRYTGRMAGDALGQMTLGEAVMMAGTGSQTTLSHRWGDYSSMNIDPLDDCTFWYTNEYIQTTGRAFWQTRVGAFKLPGCTNQ